MQIKASLTNSVKIEAPETTSSQATESTPASQNTSTPTKKNLGVADAADKFESLPGMEGSSKSEPKPPLKSTSDKVTVTGETPAQTAPAVDLSRMSIEDAVMRMFSLISKDAKRTCANR